MAASKGQGELVSYVITFLIGATVLIVVYSLVTYIYNIQIQAEVRDELKELEIQTSNSIIKLYGTGSAYSESIPNNTAILLGSVNLNYPPKVARRSYEITLVSPNGLYSTVNASSNTSIIGGQSSSGAKIVGRTVEPPFVEVVTNLPNLDIVLQGSVPNGINSVLSFYRASVNGTARSVVTLGNVSMIIYPVAGS